MGLLEEEELPLSLAANAVTWLKLGMRFGLPNGEMSGEARGVPGVSVSELMAEVMVLGLDGDMRESVDADPVTFEIMDGGKSLLSSELS